MSSIKYADRPVFFEVSTNIWINLQHIVSIEQSEWTGDLSGGAKKQKTLITMDNGSSYLFDGFADEVVSLLCEKPLDSGAADERTVL